MELSEITLDTPIKFLRENGSATHSHRRSYAKNRWLPEIQAPLVLYKRGYHTTTPRHWRFWANAQLWLVETRGDSLHGDTKSCHSSIKLTRQLDTWSPKSQRLLACQIAESLLRLTTDPRPAQTIEVARRYAHGQATDGELRAASKAASRTASGAAWAASEAASWAASEAAWAASRTASEAAQLQYAEWFLATIKGEINQ